MPNLSRKIQRVAGFLLLTIGGSVPIVPSEMTLLYSFSTSDPASFVSLDESSSTTIPLNLPYQDPDGDGEVFFSVFQDRNGNEVYAEITKRRYQQMGEKDGYIQNPEKDEYLSTFELLANQARAVVSIDASTAPTSGGTDGSSTPVIFSHTASTAPDTIRVVGVVDYSGDETASSTVTYNGVSMSHAITRVQGSYIKTRSFYLANPTGGANNVEITFNTTVSQYAVGASSFFGAEGTVSSLQSNSGTNSAAGSGTLTNTITSRTGDMTYDLIGSQFKGGNPGESAGQTSNWERSGAGIRPGASSREAGASSVTMSWTVTSTGDNWASIALNIDQVSTATEAIVTPTVTITGDIEFTGDLILE